MDLPLTETRSLLCSPISCLSGAQSVAALPLSLESEAEQDPVGPS